MITATRCIFVTLAFASGCGGPGLIEVEPEPPLDEQLEVFSRSYDVVHGTATRGPDCSHDLDRLNECPGYRRLANVHLEVDWAPDGLMVSPEAPAFTDYLLEDADDPGRFGQAGYLLLKRWDVWEEEPVRIVCDDEVLVGSQTHYYARIFVTDDEVGAVGVSEEEVRAAIERGTLERSNEQIVLQLPGCDS